jgi:hypothetical protein
MDYILERLKERSTWAGIIAILTGFGVSLKPELSAAISTVGMGIAGLVLVIIKEEKK